MNDIIEELRAGAELEETYDADGIIRTGYQMSLRWRAAAEIEKLRYQLGIVRKSREHWLHKYISLKNTILKELDISDAPVEGDD